MQPDYTEIANNSERGTKTRHTITDADQLKIHQPTLPKHKPSFFSSLKTAG